MVRVIRTSALLASLAMFASCGGPSQQPESADKAQDRAVVDAAQTWLAALDSGNYEETWNQSATVFRIGNGTSANWADAASQMRGPLGRIVSRRLKEMQPTNLQEGAAYALAFDSTFEARRSTTEEVTVVLDGGFWKVAGYMVR